MEEQEEMDESIPEIHRGPLRLALKAGDSPEILEARAHLVSCRYCLQRVAHMIGLMADAGLSVPERTPFNVIAAELAKRGISLPDIESN